MLFSCAKINMAKESQNVCLLSSFQEKEKIEYAKFIKSLPGGVFVDSSFYQPNCNVIICKFPSRGEKYLCGSAAGKNILCPNYVEDCLEARTWLPFDAYEWCNQEVQPGIDEKILSLPKRCREFIKRNNGQLIFSNWKVLLHIAEKPKRNAYKRLLESGGAKIINANPPFLINIKYKITHVFVTKELSKDFKILNRDKFENVFYPEYIAEYLIQLKPPPVKKFQCFSTDIKVKNQIKNKVQSPRKPSIPPHKARGQKTIVEIFNRKRKSVENSPSPKRICDQNISTPIVKTSIITDTETPTFFESGVKMKQRITNNSTPGISPIPGQSMMNAVVICSDIRKKPSEKNLHKQVLLSNKKKMEIIDLLSDDEGNSSTNNLKKFIPNVSVCGSTILIDSAVSSGNSVNIVDMEDTNNLDLNASGSLQLSTSSVTKVKTLSSTLKQVKVEKDHVVKALDFTNTETSLSDSELLPHLDCFLMKNTSVKSVSLRSSKKFIQETASDNQHTPPTTNGDSDVVSCRRPKKSFNECNISQEILSPSKGNEANISSRGRLRIAKRYSDCVMTSKKKVIRVNKSDSSLLLKKTENDSLKGTQCEKLFNTEELKRNKTNTSQLRIKKTEIKKSIIKVIDSPHFSPSPQSHMMIKNRSSPRLLINGSLKELGKVNSLYHSPTSQSDRIVFKGSSPNISKSRSSENTSLHSPTHKRVIIKYPIGVPFNFPINNLKCQEKAPKRSSKFIKRMTFSRRMENTIESSIDDKNFKAAFDVIKDNASSFYYPSPKIIALLLKAITAERLLRKGSEYVTLLQNVCLLHPTMKISSCYNQALEMPIEQKDGSLIATCSSWEYFMQLVNNISNTLDDDERDDDDKWRFATLNLMVVNYLVLLLEMELKTLETLGESVQSVEVLRKSLLWQLIWKSAHDCCVSSSVKELVHYAVNLAVKASSPESLQLCQLLITLISQISRCMMLKSKLQGASAFSLNCSNMVSLIEAKCTELFADDVSLSTKTCFIGQLQPSWLSYRILDWILSKYNQCFIKGKHKQLLKKPLSMNKIIYCYFFLCPKSEVKVFNKIDTTPLKDIKNNVNSLSSPRKSIGSIFRKNAKGETPLQIACIKNNASKVKELLALGADPNSKDNAGWTPLHEACNFGHLKCVEELLNSKDLNLYVTSPEGITALHDAVENDHIKVVEALLRRGGRKLMTMKTENNKSAFDFIHSPTMMKLFEKYKSHEGENVSNSTKEYLDSSIYEKIGKVSLTSMEEYLYMLLMIIRSLTSTEECIMDEEVLRTQWRLFKEHINHLNTHTSLKVKIYVKNIENALGVS